jgi:hypothetical protein
VKYVLLFFFLFAPMTWAQIETQKSVTSAVKTDKPEEAKPFLLHNATLEAIKQYSTELGIDYKLLNEKLIDKFNVYYEAHKKRKLAEKFGKNTELTEEQKNTFLAGLEAHKEVEFVQYAKLSNLVDTFAFKEIQKEAEDWKAVVVLNLNRPKVERYYSRLINPDTKTYSKIFILPEINLIGMNWADLGVDKSTTFTNVLMNSWNKWLTSNLPTNVEEIIECEGSCLLEYARWQQIPQEEGMQVSEEALNALWLRVAFNLRKVSFAQDINEWQFEWDGSVVLIDSNTKKIISSYTMLPETKTWRGFDQKTLNSVLASSLYRSPIDSLNKITKKVQETPRLNRLNRLVIQGHKHLGDVLILMDLLRKEGSKLSFEVQIDVFNQKEAQLLCFYQGEEKSFTDLLSQVKELKSSQSYRLVNEFTGIHHVLKLVAE